MIKVRRKRFDDLTVIYEARYKLVSEYEANITVDPDPIRRALNQHQLEEVQQETNRLEEEMLKLEGEIDQLQAQPQKLFQPPVKIAVTTSVAGNNLQATLPNVDVEVPFDPTAFGEVTIKEGELETLVSQRAKYVEPVPFMNGLRKSIMGVGRVELNGEACGTAILVGKNKILTNWHVVRDQKYVEGLTVRFGHFFSDPTTLEPGQVFKITKILAYKPPQLLDYALLELETDPTTEGKFNVITPSENPPYEDRIVNILHHPRGQPMKLSTQDNWVKAVKGDRVLYLTNTEPGSSGSPVFNDNWELVALHHSGKPVPPSNFPGTTEANEGIIMKAILDDIIKEGVTI